MIQERGTEISKTQKDKAKNTKGKYSQSAESSGKAVGAERLPANGHRSLSERIVWRVSEMLGLSRGVSGGVIELRVRC